MSDIAEGSLVEHPKRPEWGPGKVARVHRGKVDVFFRDDGVRRARSFPVEMLTLASEQFDPLLDHLPPFTEERGILHLPNERVSFQAARERFLKHFPGGFLDPDFVGVEKEGERSYKWAAHQRLSEVLDSGQLSEAAARRPEELESIVDQALGSASNLLATTEYIALRQGLSHPEAAARFVETFIDLVSAGPDPEAFRAHADASARLPTEGPTHTDKWTVATILPYLARPAEFIFLKPTITKAAAAALAFDIRYDPKPNWPTYDRVLTMARLYLSRLEALGARDLIDVQSFFWVTGGAYEETVAKTKRKR